MSAVHAEAYLVWVARIVDYRFRHVPEYIERADLVHAGVLGLCKAAQRYAPSRGVPFQSFARPYVLGEAFEAYCLAMHGVSWSMAREQHYPNVRGQANADFPAPQMQQDDPWLWDAVRCLPHPYSTALWLSYHEGVPLKAIGAAYQRTESMVSLWRSQGVAMLRRRLGHGERGQSARLLPRG